VPSFGVTSDHAASKWSAWIRRRDQDPALAHGGRDSRTVRRRVEHGGRRRGTGAGEGADRAARGARREEARRQGEAAEEQFEAEIERLEEELDTREDEYVADAFRNVFSGEFITDGVSLPEVHVLLGLSIMLLGLLRVVWRGTTPLPPWADHLSHGERRLEASLEKALFTMLFVVPATGLLLIAVGIEWLALHVTAQLILAAVVAAHVGLVVKHTVIHRHGHLRRML
jgi:cytochrome b561